MSKQLVACQGKYTLVCYSRIHGIDWKQKVVVNHEELIQSIEDYCKLSEFLEYFGINSNFALQIINCLSILQLIPHLQDIVMLR